MRDASQYPVTLWYGATTPPYGTPQFPYHRGVDYGAPEGTPLLVNGVLVGITGHTGFVTGPHLHLGHWVSGRDVDPGKGGFKVNGAKVLRIGEDNVNGKYVHVGDADGSYWVYLHLSRVDVKVGQELKGYMGFDYNTAPTPAQKASYIQRICFRKATPAELANTSQVWGELNGVCAEEASKGWSKANKDYNDLKNNPPGFKKVGTINGKDVYEKVG